MSKRMLPMFFSNGFIVSGLTFRPLIHFEFIFVYGVRECSDFILLHVVIQLFQHHLFKVSVSRSVTSDSFWPYGLYCLPGSSVHGILQARTLEWVAIPSPGDLPDPEVKPGSPALQVGSSPSEPPGKPPPALEGEVLIKHWTSRESTVCFFHCRKHLVPKSKA